MIWLSRSRSAINQNVTIRIRINTNSDPKHCFKFKTLLKKFEKFRLFMVNGLVFLPKYLGETGGCHWFPVEFGKHLRNGLPKVLFDNEV